MFDTPQDRIGRHEAPWISTGWDNRSIAEHVQLDTAMSVAWDLLCDQAAWLTWYARLEPNMRPPAFSSIFVGDGIKSMRSRKGKDGLFVYVPIEDFRRTPDKVAFMTDVFVYFFVKYAKAFQVEPPPAPVPSGA